MFESITGMVTGTVNTMLGPLTMLDPTLSLFIVSAMITIMIMGINKKFTNTKAVKEIKNRMQEVREQLTTAQKDGNTTEANKLLEQMMKMNNDFMKHSYKSLFISLIVISMFLPWIKGQYSGMTVASLPFEAPVIGSTMGWVTWYILVSFTIGWVIRKMFGFD